MNESNEFGPKAHVIDGGLFRESRVSNEKLLTTMGALMGRKVFQTGLNMEQTRMCLSNFRQSNVLFEHLNRHKSTSKV